MGHSSHPSTVPPDGDYIEKTLAPSSSDSDGQSEIKKPGLDSVTIFSNWTSVDAVIYQDAQPWAP